MAKDTQTIESEESKQVPLSLLATKEFGNKFKGEVTEPENEKGKETEEAEGDSDAGVQAVAEEGEEGAETEESETEEAEGAEESETEGATQEYELPQIAQLLGIEEGSLDVDDDGKIVLQGKVDSKPVRTTVKNLIDNFQMYQAADKRLEDAKVKTKAKNEELAATAEGINRQLVTGAKLIESAEQLLDKDTLGVDWKALREDDPAEYSAKKAEISERRQGIENIKQEAIAAYQQSVEENRKEGEKTIKEHLALESQHLMEKLPEWEDEEKAQAEKTKLGKYLIEQGFSKEEVQTACDHRLIIIARKAMFYDAGQGKRMAAKKKVAKIPKVLKPGTPKSQETANKEKVERQRTKLRQTGSIDDAFALLKMSSKT